MRRFGGFSELARVRAADTPDRPCLRFFDGGTRRTLTWAQFDRAVAARASDLAGAGARCEAILPDGSPESVIEVFAAVRAGLQVALIDANLPDEEAIARALRCDADAVWSVARRRTALLAGLRARRDAGEAHRGAAPTPGSVLFFTSGTTSRGKVVQLSEKSLMASAYNGASLLPLRDDDELLCVLPLSHVFGFVCGVLWGMQCGAPVSLGRGMRRFYQDFVAFDPTVCPLVPTLLAHALDAHVLGGRMRLVLVGAAPCPENLVLRTRACGIEVSAGYGLTETSSGVALSLGPDTDAMTVCPDCEVKVSASDEILVKTPTCLMKGYYGDRAVTEGLLEDGFLKTGDEGFVDERGLLHVRGRQSDVIVMGNGEKLRVPDCEAVVARGLGEEDCAVVEVEGRPVLVFGKTGAEVGALAKSALVKRVSELLEPSVRGGLLADVVRLGRPLPRTASGEVKRWQVQEEVEQWQRSTK